MADLDQLRRELDAGRARAADAAQALFIERERLRRLEDEARQLERRFDRQKGEHHRRRDELERSIAGSRARASELASAKESVLAGLAAVRDRLAPLTDPRRAIGALDANYPMLLFPLRLETRFVTHQLLVRVYPDECLVDRFEPDLSESEVGNLRRYWCGVWKAGGDDGLERAAWRELCGAHGAGRALYLIRQYAPLAGSDPVPVRTGLSDVVLVISTAAVITTAAEKTAIADYWIAAWRANNDEAPYEALRTAVGDARAAEVRSTVVPFNNREKPAAGVDRATVPISVAFVVLAPAEDVAVKRQAWTRPPTVSLLPERLLLIADSGAEHIEILGGTVQQPLVVGPDPLAEGAAQFDRVDGDLVVPPALEWMTDFEAALRAGMAFRIDLTPRQAAQGFDRLYVLGVRLTSDETRGKEELEELIEHHAQSQAGFALLPQGTPTNNTDEGASGWSRVQEADELFDVARSAQAGLERFDAAATAAYEKKDGLALAEALGIDAAVLQHVPNADGSDQAEARAMNAALWPATLGYWMDTQMRPVFDDATIERTRRHFMDRVSGRGIVPAVRIGNQPYGILPTAAFSRMDWPGFLGGLQGVLRKLAQTFWNGFGNDAPHIGQLTADPERLLLDIVGLHPSSTEFHLHVLDSAERIWNVQRFRSQTSARLEDEMRLLMRAGTDLLLALGVTGSDPEILSKFFAYVEGPMNRAVIDAAPLSESDELPICTEDGKNYVGWCREKAAHAFDDLRQQLGFAEGELPNALLYHMLRHALQLGYHDAALELHVANQLIPAAEVANAYREPAFVHVAASGANGASESRYRLLYATSAAITGDADRTVAEFIPEWVTGTGSTSALADQLEALAVLEHAPTARLERAFAEHIDLCSYRFDAWTQSLVNERLHTMRRPRGDEAERRVGLHLGAFGWLEDLRPQPSRVTSVPLNDELRAVFDAPGNPPLQRDPANGGHVLAPSLNHAVTAAVLRNGYLSHATAAEPERFAVDLSSARVRVALQFIEGIRTGQPLGALLGYQFERRLHDRHAEAELHTFIQEVRRAFPLAAKRIADSLEGDALDAPIEALEARNVCDGLLLLEHVRSSTTKTYPWGKNLARGTTAEETIVNEEVRALFEIQDAIADLAMAESVHQLTMGNVDRAAAAMDAYGKSTFPPEPEVVKTPRSGTVLTHRVALHLPMDAVAGPGATPRAEAEPSIDRWLRDVLPPMGDLVVRVRFSNSAGGAAQVDDVSMQALGLRPIDVLHLLDPSSEPAMNALDDRIVRRVIATHGLCPDASLTIRYTEPVPGKKTAFETAPLVGSLRALLLSARSLKPSDAALESEASARADAVLTVPPVQVNAARSRVEALRNDAASLTATLEPLVAEGAGFDAVVGAGDTSLSAFIALQERASLCGVALAGSGSAMKAVRDWFALVRRNAKELASTWQDKLAACDAHVAAGDDPTASDDASLEAYARAERAVSTEYTVPLPATPGVLRATVIAKRGTFLAVKAQIEAVEASLVTTILDLWTGWQDLSTARRSHDVTVADLSKEERRVRVLMSDMHQQLTGLVAELDKRLANADARIADAAAAAGEQRARLLEDAVKALLGADVRVVARFTLSADQADEWQNAFDARDALLAHASTLHDFPVDDWLYGLARVRPKLHDLEKVIQLTGAFEQPEPTLVPLQFPFRPSEPWLALELPAGFDAAGAGEHLAYSALYGAGPFDKTASAHGGLLLDEWTETIPGTQETAGLAFHYDRPSSEPPQALLLVAPAGSGERWAWLDLQVAIPETFDLARKRAAEPRDISRTALSRFLPATLMAFSASAISISSQLQAADVMFASGGSHA